MWEQFRDTNYYISREGVVKNKKGKILKPCKSCQGYLKIALYIQGNKSSFRVHRLVAEVFILNPEEKPFVNHKDGNTVNNYVSNLAWVTCSENRIHSHQILKAGTNSKKILQFDMKDQILAQFNSLREASKITQISASSISLCCNQKKASAGGFKWEHLHKNDTSFDLTEFTSIPGLEDMYLINRNGYIYSSSKKSLIKTYPNDGYTMAHINENGKQKICRVHLLVAKTFLDPPPDNGKKYIVNHKDLNRSNNSVKNLEWLSSSENIRHYWKNTNRKKIVQIFPDKNIKIYKSSEEAAKENNTTSTCITCACNQGYKYKGDKYKYISDDFYEKLVVAMKEIKIYFH